MICISPALVVIVLRSWPSLSARAAFWGIMADFLAFVANYCKAVFGLVASSLASLAFKLGSLLSLKFGTLLFDVAMLTTVKAGFVIITRNIKVWIILYDFGLLLLRRTSCRCNWCCLYYIY